MSELTNILIVGVGGQGTILAGKILGYIAQGLGKEVKVAEIHGMAQRGGGVVTQVRFGTKVYSPVISKGSADVILALEKLEALRWFSYLKPEGVIIVNDQRIDPMPVITGQVEYPEDIYDILKAKVKTIIVPGLELAKEAGSARAVNMVLLGVLAKLLGFSKEDWLTALEELLSPHMVKVSKMAFMAGYSFK